MIAITYNEAKAIQERQLVYYRQRIGRVGLKAIRIRTLCPVDMNPDEPLSIFIINKLVPRGTSIENLCRYRPDTSNDLGYYWHNAMENGKIYSA